MSHYCPGIITRVHHNSTCDVRYQNGEEVLCVEPNIIRYRIQTKITPLQQFYSLEALAILVTWPSSSLATSANRWRIDWFERGGESQRSAAPIVLPLVRVNHRTAFADAPIFLQGGNAAGGRSVPALDLLHDAAHSHAGLLLDGGREVRRRRPGIQGGMAERLHPADPLRAHDRASDVHGQAVLWNVRAESHTAVLLLGLALGVLSTGLYPMYPGSTSARVTTTPTGQPRARLWIDSHLPVLHPALLYDAPRARVLPRPLQWRTRGFDPGCRLDPRARPAGRCSRAPRVAWLGPAFASGRSQRSCPLGPGPPLDARRAAGRAIARSGGGSAWMRRPLLYARRELSMCLLSARLPRAMPMWQFTRLRCRSRPAARRSGSPARSSGSPPRSCPRASRGGRAAATR